MYDLGQSTDKLCTSSVCKTEQPLRRTTELSTIHQEWASVLGMHPKSPRHQYCHVSNQPNTSSSLQQVSDASGRGEFASTCPMGHRIPWEVARIQIGYSHC